MNSCDIFCSFNCLSVLQWRIFFVILVFLWVKSLFLDTGFFSFHFNLQVDHTTNNSVMRSCETAFESD